MTKYYDYEWTDETAIAWLRGRGYFLDRCFMWHRTANTPHEPSEKDWSAIDYLVFEWDYGGLTNKIGCG